MQCLYSRWRVGEVESVGKYPRRLATVVDDGICRLCHHSEESTLHLATCCEGTDAYRLVHDISRWTLVHESPGNILRIVEFDQWLRCQLQYDRKPPDFGMTQTLKDFYHEQRKRRKAYEDAKTESGQVGSIGRTSGVRTAKRQRKSRARRYVKTVKIGLMASTQRQKQRKRKSLTQNNGE